VHSLISWAATTDPRALPNLAAWYRADDVVDAGGGAISQWNDRSGNGRHATQATGSRRPTLVASVSALRNQPALSFDGNDALLTAAFTLPRECTVLFVLGSLTSRGMICEHGFATNWYVYSLGNAAFYCQSHNTIQSPATTWAQANQQGSAVYTRTAFATLRGNRVDLVPTSTAGSPPGAANTSAILTLGNREDLTLPHNGQIAEICVYSRALSASEVARIEGYLLQRYGV
jgi:hypothetical protein